MKNILFLILFFLSKKPIIGQDTTLPFDIKTNCQYLPALKKQWAYHHSLNTTLIFLPNSWLEQTISAPMLYYRSNFYLPLNLIMQNDLKTIGIANEIRTGLGFQHSFSNHLHSKIGYQFGYNFGFLNSFGYNNDIKVLQHHPFFEIGYYFNEIAFTLIAKIDFTGKIYYSAGDVENSFNTRDLNGGSIGIMMEQPIFKKKTFLIGFTVNYNQFHILGWPAFNTIRKRFLIPEFTFGFKL